MVNCQINHEVCQIQVNSYFCLLSSKIYDDAPLANFPRNKVDEIITNFSTLFIQFLVFKKCGIYQNSNSDLFRNLPYLFSLDIGIENTRVELNQN